MVAALVWGCGGSAPAPESEHHREVLDTPSKNAAGEKGSGGINFVYSNKSTDARMDIDLGSTDVYLEMSGRPAKSIDETGHDRGSSEKPAAQANRSNPMAPSQASNEEPELAGPAKESGAKRFNKKPMAEDTEPVTENVNNEDVTAKVLAGIRRAQELFYQKRYTEALQMVRQSLDASPTAEGHALAGSICYMMSKNGLARRHWEEALRLNPDMPAVVNMLERTRTPGGRGSPSPRPLVNRAPVRPPASVMEAAMPESEQPPYPEVFRGESKRIPVASPPVVPTKAIETEPAEEPEVEATEDAEVAPQPPPVQAPIAPKPEPEAKATAPKPVFPSKAQVVAKPIAPKAAPVVVDSVVKKPKKK
jgi:hypothetical protein